MFAGPAEISTANFAPLFQLNRPGLLLANGMVYIGTEVQKLETEFAHLIVCRFAVSCVSGSDALVLPMIKMQGFWPQLIRTPSQAREDLTA
jgi:hypothetical protein